MAAAAAAAVAALTVIQLFVQDGARSWRTVWAEDGRIYFGEANRDGLLALFHTKAGYLQLVPRLLAVPTTLIPLTRLADYLAVAGALVTSLTGLAVFFLTRDLIKPVALRLILAAAPALLPVMAFENLANITNLIWPLCFACFWALLYAPATRKEGAFAATVAFLGTASNGLAVVFLPLAAYVAWRRRTPAQHLVLAGYGLGLAVQAAAVVGSGGPVSGGPVHGLGREFVARVLAGSAVGEQWARQLFEAHGYGILEIPAAVVLVLIAYLVLRSRGERRQLGCIAVGYSAVLFAAPLLVRGTVGLRLVAGLGFSAAARYVGLSTLLLLSGIFIMVGAPTLRPKIGAVLTTIFVVQFLVVVLFAIPQVNFRSHGPEWAAALSRAATQCRATKQDHLAVPITPGGWSVTLPCAQILAG